MINRVTTLIAVLFVATIAVAQIPQFSADYVNTFSAQVQKSGVPGTQTGKFYISGTKMRMDFNQAGQEMQMIVDGGPKGKAYNVMPQTKTYMVLLDGEDESEENQKKGADLSAYLTSGGDVCKADPSLTSCKKLGADSVAGRSCDVYETIDKRGSSTKICVDPRLHFPLRIVAKDNTIELKNIKEGPQPASLFLPPPGYKKMDFGD